jgi:hypothetical protein
MFFIFTAPLWLLIIIWIIKAIAASGQRKQAMQILQEAAKQLKTCTMCAETIKIQAQVCHYCGHKCEPMIDHDKVRDERFTRLLQETRPIPRPIDEWKLLDRSEWKLTDREKRARP